MTDYGKMSESQNNYHLKKLLKIAKPDYADPPVKWRKCWIAKIICFFLKHEKRNVPEKISNHLFSKYFKVKTYCYRCGKHLEHYEWIPKASGKTVKFRRYESLPKEK